MVNFTKAEQKNCHSKCIGGAEENGAVRYAEMNTIYYYSSYFYEYSFFSLSHPYNNMTCEADADDDGHDSNIILIIICIFVIFLQKQARVHISICIMLMHNNRIAHLNLLLAIPQLIQPNNLTEVARAAQIQNANGNCPHFAILMFAVIRDVLPLYRALLPKRINK